MFHLEVIDQHFYLNIGFSTPKYPYGQVLRSVEGPPQKRTPADPWLESDEFIQNPRVCQGSAGREVYQQGGVDESYGLVVMLLWMIVIFHWFYAHM